jgi:hypothetical protein
MINSGLSSKAAFHQIRKWSTNHLKRDIPVAILTIFKASFKGKKLRREGT